MSVLCYANFWSLKCFEQYICICGIRWQLAGISKSQKAQLNCWRMIIFIYAIISSVADSPIEAADRCTHTFRSFNTNQYFQVLRVFYVLRPSLVNSKRSKSHVINCMTFTPVQTTLGLNVHAQFESMKHTMNRISAWLQLSGKRKWSVECQNESCHQELPRNGDNPELKAATSIPYLVE